MRVDDPRVLRALAHPLRIRLLGLLRLEGASTARATAALSVLAAGALVLLGFAQAIWLLAVGAVLFYLLNGGGWPLRDALLHSRVDAGQRATMVSVGSLALQLGGVLGVQVHSRLYEHVGQAAAFVAAAGVLVLVGLLQLRLPPIAHRAAASVD